MGKGYWIGEASAIFEGERGVLAGPNRIVVQCFTVYIFECISKRRSRDRVLMRLMHSRFARTVIAAARVWPLETARRRSGTSWRVGEVGKHGPLFLFGLTRGLEKAGVEARQVGKLRIAGRNVQAAGYSPTF